MAQANANKCKDGNKESLPLSSLNHISRTCLNVSETANFYENFLGFVQIKRPGSFNFDGAWLFNYGIGIHLLQSESGKFNASEQKEIDPKSDHISFQCEDINIVEMRLKENDIKYLRTVVEEGGILVDQLFFHDPDGFMIEVCNCDLLPVVPLGNTEPITIQQQQLLPSCKRTSSCTTVSPRPTVSIPNHVSHNLRQGGTQIGHEEYAICG